MKKFPYFFLLIVYIASSCTSNEKVPSLSSQSDPNDRLDYCKVISKINAETRRELQNRYKLKSGGWGSGAMDLVQTCSIDMKIDRSIDIEEARRLLVNCVEIYLHNINSNKVI